MRLAIVFKGTVRQLLAALDWIVWEQELGEHDETETV